MYKMLLLSEAHHQTLIFQAKAFIRRILTRVVRVPYTTKVPYIQVPQGIRYLNDKVVHWDS